MTGREQVLMQVLHAFIAAEARFFEVPFIQIQRQREMIQTLAALITSSEASTMNMRVPCMVVPFTFGMPSSTNFPLHRSQARRAAALPISRPAGQHPPAGMQAIFVKAARSHSTHRASCDRPAEEWGAHRDGWNA